MWICDPDFVNLTPVQTLHKQMDKSVEIKPDPALANRHMLVRRAFEAAAGDKLSLSITADDYYKLYLNGELIGVGPAQAYADRYPVNRYDLTDRVKPGRNVLAVHVFYMGTITRAWQSGDNRQGLWMKLTGESGAVILESDRTCRVCCPTAWRQKGLLGYSTQFIEDVYGAEIPEGWKEADFDDSAWRSACEHPGDDHVLVEQITPPVRVYEQKPALIERRGDAWFVDMGAETVGTAHCAAKASGGGVIELRMGEELSEDGTVRWKMRCNCDYRLWWHLSGRERDETDFFDYMAFRYIEIVDPEGVVEPESVGVTARHYPMPENRGHFHCDQPLLNGIFDICRQGVMLGAQEAFLDCPSREKGQYLGDGTITAHTHLLLTGDARMYRKMLYDFAASARVCPGLMAVAPGNEMQEIADYSCQYPEQIMTYYELTGDIHTVRA
ncbi:MAG: family 78 glycoside hydrolase catalytic domain, partial [Clostridia bacterium]|nr:family 78 glycoside hydrolase catalytic domain [Clostridia bacterium]